MTTLFIDEEPKYGSQFALGILVIHNKEWLKEYRRDLHNFYGPPVLYFHATIDKQSNLSKCHDLRNHIRTTLVPILKEGDRAGWHFVKGKGEYSAWITLMQWIRHEFKPSQKNPVTIMYDRRDFSRDTKNMLSGYSKTEYILRPVDKIKPTETSPDQNTYMVGIVDYILHFKIFRDLERIEKGRKE